MSKEHGGYSSDDEWASKDPKGYLVARDKSRKKDQAGTFTVATDLTPEQAAELDAKMRKASNDPKAYLLSQKEGG